MTTSRQLIARLLLPLLLVGCDGRDEPLEPHGPALASAVVGTYELTVQGGTDLGGGQWQVPSPSGWTLVAHIAFPDATPVTGGTVVFYFLLDGRWIREGGAAQVNTDGGHPRSGGRIAYVFPVQVHRPGKWSEERPERRDQRITSDIIVSAV